MRKLLSFMFALSAIVWLSCDTQQADLTNQYIPVTLVDQICGSAIFKIQHPDFFQYGENIETHENVFFGRIECPSSDSGNIEELTIPTSVILYAELDPEDFKSGCAICLAVINYPGSKHYNVRIHTSTTEN